MERPRNSSAKREMIATLPQRRSQPSASETGVELVIFPKSAPLPSLGVRRFLCQQFEVRFSSCCPRASPPRQSTPINWSWARFGQRLGNTKGPRLGRAVSHGMQAAREVRDAEIDGRPVRPPQQRLHDHHDPYRAPLRARRRTRRAPNRRAPEAAADCSGPAGRSPRAR